MSACADHSTEHSAPYQAQSWGKEPAKAGFVDVARGFIHRAVLVLHTLSISLKLHYPPCGAHEQVPFGLRTDRELPPCAASIAASVCVSPAGSRTPAERLPGSLSL